MRRNMILSQFAENWRHKVLWLHRKGMSLYLTGGLVAIKKRCINLNVMLAVVKVERYI